MFEQPGAIEAVREDWAGALRVVEKGEEALQRAREVGHELVDRVRADDDQRLRRELADLGRVGVQDLGRPGLEALPALVAARGLRCEGAVIVLLAARLTELLRRGDPLAGRVALRKTDFLSAGVRGALWGLTAR